MHVYETTIRLQNTDAAGIVFFADFFDLAHVAYEDLLEHIGHPLPADLGHGDLILPLVRAEADYLAPLRLSERVRIEVAVREITSRGFTLGYRFLRADGSEAARLTTGHMAVDRVAGKAARLPEDLATALGSL